MTTADELLLKRLKPKTVRQIIADTDYAVNFALGQWNCQMVPEARRGADMLRLLWEYYREHEERK